MSEQRYARGGFIPGTATITAQVVAHMQGGCSDLRHVHLDECIIRPPRDNRPMECGRMDRRHLVAKHGMSERDAAIAELEFDCKIGRWSE